MADRDIALMAHLLRRAAFGASRDEIEARAAKGFDATVEEFLNPEQQPELEEDPAVALAAFLLPGPPPLKPMCSCGYTA